MSEDLFSPAILETIEYQTETCPVLWVKNNTMIIINFQGYGITLDLDFLELFPIPFNSETITVKYTGTIGSPDFQFIID